MRKQIQHMIKYKYVPFSFGKTKYSSKETKGEKGENKKATRRDYSACLIGAARPFTTEKVLSCST